MRLGQALNFLPGHPRLRGQSQVDILGRFWSFSQGKLLSQAQLFLSSGNYLGKESSAESLLRVLLWKDPTEKKEVTKSHSIVTNSSEPSSESSNLVDCNEKGQTRWRSSSRKIFWLEGVVRGIFRFKGKSIKNLWTWIIGGGCSQRTSSQGSKLTTQAIS